MDDFFVTLDKLMNPKKKGLRSRFGLTTGMVKKTMTQKKNDGFVLVPRIQDQDRVGECSTH